MIRTHVKILIVGLLLSGGVSVSSCKSKPKDTGNTDTTAIAPVPDPVTPAPVEIAADDSLTTGVKDATKDYPTVKADVANGEVTLTGELSRSKLQGLMQTLHTLHPKKINNNLTLK